ncbi:MAG TPA: DUF4397 domain-containing protein [Mucilaginibacter sp.]|jgi:hypothetical protein|nr:DUF4397 domain-containing protein [Mucilaginibacter sp.]
MKKILYIALSLFITGLIAACKKDIIPSTAALNVINASSDIPSVAVNFTLSPISFYKQNAILSYGSSSDYPQSAGIVPLTLVSSIDTTHNIFQGNLNLAAGGIYSLYLYGSLPKIDTLFLKDNIPVHQDSTCGIRFINLSSDSGPISVDVQGGTTVDFSSIAFKYITAFKTYPVTAAIKNNGGYIFEVKDATGNILTTVSWNFKIFQNNTLVISGSKARSTMQVIQVNNY